MKILFVYPVEATFVQADREILEGFADVTSLHAPPGTGFPALAEALRRHDLAFVWFGLGHASRLVLAGRILRRPTLLVGGGWDVADMPEIGYGAARGAYGRTRAALTFGLATRVLAFSRWSEQEIRRLAPRARVETLYLGVDPDRWIPASQKEPLVLTIGGVNESNLRRKGLETFARASALVPEARFVIAGRVEPRTGRRLTSLGASNLELTGELANGALRDFATRAQVYVQASYTEGFGLAVAEAMSAGCVPVVTRAGALPEVVGEAGLFVPYGDVDATAEAIREALRSGKGAEARGRVVERFTIRRRAEGLQRAVREVSGRWT